MQRHIHFENAVNFRDLGGYATADGHVTRWEVLYRSGHLANLSDADIAQLRGLNLNFICDFRTVEEQQRGPSRIPDDMSIDRLALDIWPEAARVPTDVVKSMIFDGETIDQVHETHRQMYSSLALDYADRYAKMFASILKGEGKPSLIHCRGGRDRTGFGAAMILTALGVPCETIMDDYLLTNAAPTANDFIKKMIKLYAEDTPGRSREELNALFNEVFPVRAENLQIAFEAVESKYGSADGYIRDALGVNDDAKKALQSWFLEPAA